jgi:hypothetical protein
MSYPKSSSLNPQVCKVEIIPVEDVQGINIGSTRMHSSVSLKSGKSWQLIYSTPGKIDFSEEQQDDPAGPCFTQKLEFPYPGEDPSMRASLNNIENQRLLIRLTFNSGVMKLLGNLENPCLCKNSFSSDKGGHIISFSRKSPEPSFVL